MESILLVEDWRDITVSSLTASLAYILLDILQRRSLNTLSLASFLAVFLGLFAILQLYRRLSDG